MIVEQLNFQLPVQSVPIITKAESFNPAHGDVCSIQHYVINFVSGLWCFRGIPVTSTNKTDCHNVTEILLKGVLNTINLTLYYRLKMAGFV